MKRLKRLSFLVIYALTLFIGMPLASQIKEPEIIQKLTDKNLVNSITKENNRSDIIEVYTIIYLDFINTLAPTFKWTDEQKKVFFNKFMNNFTGPFTENLVNRIAALQILENTQMVNELVSDYRNFLKIQMSGIYKIIFGKTSSGQQQKVKAWKPKKEEWERETVKPLAKKFEAQLTHLILKKEKPTKQIIEPAKPLSQDFEKVRAYIQNAQATVSLATSALNEKHALIEKLAITCLDAHKENYQSYKEARLQANDLSQEFMKLLEQQPETLVYKDVVQNYNATMRKFTQAQSIANSLIEKCAQIKTPGQEEPVVEEPSTLTSLDEEEPSDEEEPDLDPFDPDVVRPQLTRVQKALKTDITLLQFFEGHLKFLNNSKFILTDKTPLQKINYLSGRMRQHYTWLEELLQTLSPETIRSFFYGQPSPAEFLQTVRTFHQKYIQKGSKLFITALTTIKDTIREDNGIYINIDNVQITNPQSLADKIIVKILENKKKQGFLSKLILTPKSLLDTVQNLLKATDSLDKRIALSQYDHIDTLQDKPSTYEDWTLTLGVRDELAEYKKRVEELSTLLSSLEFQNNILDTLKENKIQDKKILTEVLTILYGPYFIDKLIPELQMLYHNPALYFMSKKPLPKKPLPKKTPLKKQPLPKKPLPHIPLTKDEKLFAEKAEEALSDLGMNRVMIHILKEIVVTTSIETNTPELRKQLDQSLLEIKQQTEDINELVTNPSKRQKLLKQLQHDKQDVSSYYSGIMNNTREKTKQALTLVNQVNQQAFKDVQDKHGFNLTFNLNKPTTEAEQHLVTLLEPKDKGTLMNPLSWQSKTTRTHEALKKQIKETINHLQGIETIISEQEDMFASFEAFKESYERLIRTYLINKEEIDFTELERSTSLELKDMIKQMNIHGELYRYEQMSNTLTQQLESDLFKTVLYDYVQKAKITSEQVLYDLFSLLYGEKEVTDLIWGKISRAKQEMLRFLVKNTDYMNNFEDAQKQDEEPFEKPLDDEELSSKEEPIEASKNKTSFHQELQDAVKKGIAGLKKTGKNLSK